ncbi:DUF1361 domain-containing protein [Gorillibacterium massiliense]|uniref:DUF1361 domain-containing protein n=1 Tax=Gorillibacterium massiliense TaxID=1280390 RepID=UPI0004B529C8|nr:DUF1361 domain-containing protein [Gorillibacterium massiliense]
MFPSRVMERKIILRWLILLAAFTFIDILLIFWVIRHQGTPKYLFLIWNLFLAWLPLFFALGAVHKQNDSRLMFIFRLGCSILWLLFYPNGPYMITDLKHYREVVSYPGAIWPYDDLLMLFSSAWTGMMLGALSLFLLHQGVRRRYGSYVGWIFALSALFLGSIGVYVGRFLRWNSWDVLTNPHQLLQELSHILEYQSTDFIFLFSAIQLVTYATVYFLAQNQTDKH